MRAEDLIVEVRDRTLARLGVIPPQDLNVECYPTHNGVGSWTVTLPQDHRLTPALAAPGSGVIITGPQGVILSGPTETATLVESTEDPGGSLTFAGVGDTTILQEKLAFPCPLQSQGMNDARYDTRTGPAESLMYGYVKDNLGPNGRDDRRLDYLTFGDDQGRGSTITKKARYDTLLDLLTDMATPDDLGFRVYQSDDQLVFEVYQVADRTRRIRLDVQLGSLSSQQAALTAPTITRAIVGSQDNTGSRIVTIVKADPSVEADWGRSVEVFVNGQDSNTESARQQAGTEALAAGPTGIAVQATPSEDSPMEFGKDWFLGDRVSAVMNGQEWPQIVTGAALKASPDAVIMGLTLGDGGVFDDGLTSLALDTAQRVSVLERNQADPLIDGGTALATAASGWSITSQNWKRVGDTVQFWLSVTRTGAAITAPANGDFLNVAVATVSADWSPIMATPASPGGTGPAVNYVLSGGTLYLVSGLPNQTINTNDSLDVGATYIAASAGS